MSLKQLTRVTCTAGLLLVELAPTATAQSIEPPVESGDDDAPITNQQNRATFAQVHTRPDDVAIAAQPERFAEVESTPRAKSALAHSAEPAHRNGVPVSSRPVELASSISRPERLSSLQLAPIRTKDLTVSTRAQDLSNAKPMVIMVSQPETIEEKGKRRKEASRERKAEGVQELALSPISTNRQPQPPIATPAAETLGDRPSPILSQTPLDANASTPPAAAPPISPRIGADLTTGPGVGYSSSFTGVRGFVPIAQQPGRITFAEGQAFLSTSGGDPGANLVVGHRFYDHKSDRIYGGYVAYDYRNTGKNSFNQVGLGVETLGRKWDARANVYLPIGNTRQLTSEHVTSSTTSSDPFFQGNFLATTRTTQQQSDRRFEAAAAGVDIEAGTKIANLGKSGELRGYGGLYYFGAPGGEGAVGFRARLEARPTQDIRVGLALSTDKNYGTSLAFNVGVTFPTHRSSRDSVKDPLLARLGDSVNRNSNIVLDRQVESSRSTTQATQLITNPGTGQPFRFRHANPGIGAGVGTFENPTGDVASALAVAQPDDIVYVQPGTNPGIPAFTIPDRVQVLSTGPAQRIDTVEFGNLQLPLSGAGVLPSVQGTVTLGNQTTLSGFAISTATGAGIAGSNINQVTVRDNAIANTAGQGISLNNVQGAIAVIDNTIRQSGLEGFSLTNNQGQVDLLLARNQIANNGANAVDGDGVSIELRNNAAGNLTIANNTIANNSAIGGIADGVEVQLFDAANGNLNLTDNQITGNQANGVAIDLESTAQGTFNIARNTISSNQLSGAALLLSNDARGQFALDGNTIANNQLGGFQAVLSDNTNSTINLTNNAIASNQGDGIFLQTSDQAQAIANILSNSLTNNAGSGIFTSANGTSQLRSLADSNVITGNGASGVSINTGDSALTAGALRANTITGNTFNDVEAFNTAPGATACIQPLNNSIGTLVLDDSSGALGQVQLEAGSLPTNTITSTDFSFWSGTLAPAGACGF